MLSILHLQTTSGTKYLILTPDRCLIFPSVDYVKNLVNKLGVKSQVPVVLDCSHIYGADYTAAKVIETLVSDFTARRQLLIFYNLKPTVCQVFEGVDTEISVCYDINALEKAINENKWWRRTLEQTLLVVAIKFISLIRVLNEKTKMYEIYSWLNIASTYYLTKW